MKHPSPKSTILAQIPLSRSPAMKSNTDKSTSGTRNEITVPAPQKMNPAKFENRLKILLSHTDFSEIFYEKTVLDIHHIIVVNWRVFEYEILGKHGLWGRSRCFSTFNREVIVQGYQKVKFQSSDFNQKVLIYLRSVESNPDTLRSHIPCFIPAAEIRKKQASLNRQPRFKAILQSRKCTITRKTLLSTSGKCNCTSNIASGSSTVRDEKESQSNQLVQTTERKVVSPGKVTNGIDPAKESNSFSLQPDQSNQGNLKTPCKKRKLSEITSSDESHCSRTMCIDRLKLAAVQNIVESLVDEHIKSLLEMIVDDAIGMDDRDRDDVLLWDPTRQSEKHVVRFLKEWTTFSDPKQEHEEIHSNSLRLQSMNTRQPDIEAALWQLSGSNYDIEKVLQIRKLGKYTIFVDEENTQTRESGRITNFSHDDLTAETQNKPRNPGLRRVKRSDHSRKYDEVAEQKSWTAKMKLNFEKGLILFGENVDKILEHFHCFEHLKPIHLDWYFYSHQRQKFIGNPENSKKVVDILDQTPLKHLQKIEFFELGKDWAKMRQNIPSSSSDSSDDAVCMQIRKINKFGRTVRTMKQKKKRPKRLPDRFMNFQM